MRFSRILFQHDYSQLDKNLSNRQTSSNWNTFEEKRMADSTASASNTAPPQPMQGAGPAGRKPLSPRARLILAIAGLAIAAALLIYGIEWFLHGRFIESTDDAYLRADSVTIAPRVSGYIDEIYIKENQHVTAGTPLLHIDKRNYQDTLSQQSASVVARTADLDAADSQIKQQQDVIAQNHAQAASAHAKAQFSRAQAERYRTLSEQGADTEEKYAQAQNQRLLDDAAEAAAAAGLRAATSQLGVLKSQREQAMAQLASSKAQVNAAQQNLDDTVLKASVDGTVGDDTARVGQYVQPGTRLMSVVPVQSVYLIANFKETQIKNMRIGQKAKLEVDAIGGAEIDAQIESFAPGTGSQFALLPPENATGNFIKIVQRVPVRLRVIPPKDVADRLLPGLSVKVYVDTSGPGHAS
jgi:membrane fusion protein (multidrug efflux system)